MFVIKEYIPKIRNDNDNKNIIFLIVLKYKYVDMPMTGTSLNLSEHIFNYSYWILNPQHGQH